MDAAHIHLMITHLAVLGSLLGAFVLIHALWSKNNPTKIAAYNLLILTAAGGIIAYLTGEGAEEVVENLPGITETTIEQHEDFAIFTLVSLIILGLTSLLGLFVTFRKSAMTRTVAYVALVMSLISFGFAARTGYLGGKIRHTEINSGTPALQQDGASGEEEDED
jgi:uncharacterized protein YacL